MADSLDKICAVHLLANILHPPDQTTLHYRQQLSRRLSASFALSQFALSSLSLALNTPPRQQQQPHSSEKRERTTADAARGRERKKQDNSMRVCALCSGVEQSRDAHDKGKTQSEPRACGRDGARGQT
eukprot:759189-Rhodomonas_salina.1